MSRVRKLLHSLSEAKFIKIERDSNDGGDIQDFIVTDSKKGETAKVSFSISKKLLRQLTFVLKEVLNKK